jgi:hypothetical protein
MPGYTRSMNADLHEGATDGKYKKVVQNRGGVVEGATWAEREDLYDPWYGIHEIQPKVVPSNGSAYTPDYVPTPRAVMPVAL